MLALTLLAVQGCAPTTPTAAATGAAAGAATGAATGAAAAIGAAPGTGIGTGTGHGLNIAAARQVYQQYLQASTSDATQGDKTQALAILSDVQWAQVKAQYTALAVSGTPVPTYQYSAPQFYVPALSEYPHWFVVSAQQRTDTDGHLGAPVTTLMLFDNYKAGKPWTLNGITALDGTLPKIATRDGYAISVSASDPSLLLPPDVVGPTQAAVVDQGPSHPAAALTDGGPQTTGLYTAHAAQASADKADGLQYVWLLEGADFAQFELRLSGGGALVLYGMSLNTTTEHPNLVAGPPIPVPAAFAPLLATPTEVGDREVQTTWTYQFAAIDPPASARDAKVDVIAATGAPSSAKAS